jgi:hypothetical protein
MVMRDGAGCVFRLSALPSIAGIASHCREPLLSTHNPTLCRWSRRLVAKLFLALSQTPETLYVGARLSRLS